MLAINILKVLFFSFAFTACSESHFAETRNTEEYSAGLVEVTEEKAELEDDQKVLEPVSIGGTFLCGAESASLENQNISCRFEGADKEVPWNLMTIRAGDEFGLLQTVEFSVSGEGINFLWSLESGYYVQAELDTQNWGTKIQTPFVSIVRVPCSYENPTGCFFLGGVGQSCSEVCSDKGGFDLEGTVAANANLGTCTDALVGLNAETFERPVRSISNGRRGVVRGTGCGVEHDPANGGNRRGNSNGRWYIIGDYPEADAFELSKQRVCACLNGF